MALIFVIIYVAISSLPSHAIFVHILIYAAAELNHKRKLTCRNVEIHFVCFSPSYDRDAIRNGSVADL